jgi:mRNA interferase RelE/StbE
MIYNIERSKKAKKYFQTADKSIKNGFFKKAHLLAQNPTESNTALDIAILKGASNTYRLRVGSYRIIYEVREQSLLVLIVDMDSRGAIYKKR